MSTSLMDYATIWLLQGKVFSSEAVFGEEFVFCGADGPNANPVTDCQVFRGFPNECVCPEGLLVDMEQASDLCNPAFNCLSTDLNLVTPSPTLSEVVPSPGT